jgi:hypothetical protein
MPTILSETRSKIIGKINPNEDKHVDLRFLPLKNGFNRLAPFTIRDNNSNKTFFVIYPNKIYIEEK